MKGVILTAIVLVIAHRQVAAEEQLIFDYDAVMACLEESKILCKGDTPGEGRIEACIKRNASKLTPGCAKAFARIVAEQSRSSPVKDNSRPLEHRQH